MEKEWYSTSCTAPPLWGVNVFPEATIGVCMKCRDKTTLSLHYKEIKTQNNPTIFDDIFSAHLGIKKEKETK